MTNSRMTHMDFLEQISAAYRWMHGQDTKLWHPDDIAAELIAVIQTYAAIENTRG